MLGKGKKQSIGFRTSQASPFGPGKLPEKVGKGGKAAVSAGSNGVLLQFHPLFWIVESACCEDDPCKSPWPRP